MKPAKTSTTADEARQHAHSETAWRAGWQACSRRATALAAVIGLFRLAVVVTVTWVVARTLAHPHGWLALVAWWVALSALGMMALALTHHLTRRLLPLIALLRLDVAFPDVAPSRFRTALHAGSTRTLHRSNTRLLAHDTQPDDAATALLELVGALSAHDGLTRGHSERVRAYTELIAEEMGISKHERHQLRWGGLVHDVGKIRVPREVLNKRSSLDDSEWELIRKHPLDGLQLAAPLQPWLGSATLAVSDHHERWEGGGYPSGVAGEDISLGGRIVAVADAFDVMTSARSYKRPMPAHAARAELVACSGKQFDPAVVRAFLAISLPRLRAVLGPLASVQAAVQLQWQVTRYPRPRQAVVAALITGVTYVGGALGMTEAPDKPRPTSSAVQHGTGPGSQAGPGGLAAATAPQASAAPVFADHDPREPVPPAAAPRTVQPDSPAKPAGPRSAPSPQPTSSPPSGVDSTGGIVIDPAAGSVAVFPPGTLPLDAPPLVSAPPVGDLACGQLQVCSPIVVHLPPLPLIRLSHLAAFATSAR